jgi:hypothetical protein
MQGIEYELKLQGTPLSPALTLGLNWLINTNIILTAGSTVVVKGTNIKLYTFSI